jgi:ubiquinone/menaquinone biosynthesis C-methylase UbiE
MASSRDLGPDHAEPAARTGSAATNRVRHYYDRTAKDYDSWLRLYERLMGFGDRRRRLLTRARGSTIELGVGTGLNLRHYPRDVRLTGVDLSPGMLEVAAWRAGRLGLEADFWIGDAHGLPFPSATFDTAVVTLFLSAVPEHRGAIAEIRRVLKPGGRVLVLDHVRSSIPAVRWIQQLVQPVLANYAGWQFTRDPDEDLRSAGFIVDECRRTRLGMLEELVATSRDSQRLHVDRDDRELRP